MSTVRVVGLVKGQKSGRSSCLRKGDVGNKVQISNAGSSIGWTEFVLDECVWTDDDDVNGLPNAKLFDLTAKPLLEALAEGYNCSLIAYGETGSGKTHSILGTREDPGIMRRALEAITRDPLIIQTELTYVEIYNDKVFDLLRKKPNTSAGSPSRRSRTMSESKESPCRVRENPEFGPFVEGTNSPVLRGPDAAAAAEVLLRRGELTRRVASTEASSRSSRSHTVLTATVTRQVDNCTRRARLVVADLGGTGQGDGTLAKDRKRVTLDSASLRAGTARLRQEEGSVINRSIVALGKVINELGKKGRRAGSYIPYRDSTLTWLLKESLGGNSRACLLATLNPDMCNCDETFATLRFSEKSRRIVNTATRSVAKPSVPQARDSSAPDLLDGKGVDATTSELAAELAAIEAEIAAVEASETKTSLLETSRLENELTAAVETLKKELDDKEADGENDTDNIDAATDQLVDEQKETENTGTTVAQPDMPQSDVITDGEISSEAADAATIQVAADKAAALARSQKEEANERRASLAWDAAVQLQDEQSQMSDSSELLGTKLADLDDSQKKSFHTENDILNDDMSGYADLAFLPLTKSLSPSIEHSVSARKQALTRGDASVRIMEHITVAASVNERRAYTLYSIQVVTDAKSAAPLQWTVKRRYREFHKLLKRLQTTRAGVSLRLPPKNSIVGLLLGRSLDRDFVRERLRGLNSFLHNLYSNGNLRSTPYALDFIDAWDHAKSATGHAGGLFGKNTSNAS